MREAHEQEEVCADAEGRRRRIALMINGRGKANELSVRLYVADRAPTSVQAIRNLETIQDENSQVSWRVEIVDGVVEPLRALADGVVVTPTLIRTAPWPEVWIVGDLSDQAQVCASLGLDMVLSERCSAGNDE